MFTLTVNSHCNSMSTSISISISMSTYVTIAVPISARYVRGRESGTKKLRCVVSYCIPWHLCPRAEDRHGAISHLATGHLTHFRAALLTKDSRHELGPGKSQFPGVN